MLHRKALDLVINGVSIERELRVRILGVILDECLNWRDQIQYVTDKISKYVGIFYNVRSSLTVTSLILLYNSFVYSHLMYCNSVWCLAPRKYLDPLHKTQKKLVRAMSHSHYLAHSAPLMKQLSILNIFDVNFYHTCLLVFKAVQNNHNPLHSYFNFRTGLHNTRLIFKFKLLSCHRPVTLGLHSVALPLEHVRLSGICWVLIQMVEWTRLVASLCSFRRLLLFLLQNWVVYFVDCCVVVSFRSSGGLQMWLQFPKVPYRRLSATIGRFRLHQFCRRFLKGWSLCVLVVFWRDLGSCLLTSTHTGRDWEPVMLFLTSSVLVSWN